MLMKKLCKALIHFLSIFLHLKVRSFYRRCGGQADRASCNCAVAIQAGDDVVIFDKCGPSATNENSFYPMSAHMFRRGILTPGFRVLSQYEGRQYKVIVHNGFYSISF